LQAKLFGGGKMITELPDVGMRNAAFAQKFLSMEGIEYVGGSLGGELARRVDFWPVSGRARQKFVHAEQAPVRQPVSEAPVHEDSGELELF
jgi:chemotaxis protein CheD